MRRVRALDATPAVFVSALDADTHDALRDTLLTRVRGRLASVVVSVPVVDGETIAAIYREGEVTERTDESMRVSLTARIPVDLLGRLNGRKDVSIQEVA